MLRKIALKTCSVIAAAVLLVALGFALSRPGAGGAPTVAEGFPGAPGDTTADFVLGQFDFTHTTPNLVDGAGVDTNSSTPPFLWGAVAIDTTVSPNRVYVAGQR